MPKPTVSIDNMNKHLTAAEKLARQNAEQELKRSVVKLRKPDYVKDDELADAFWKKTIKLMKDVTLLDDLDSDMLAAYCMISARWQRLASESSMVLFGDKLMRLEAAERNRLSYAEKLGLTPSGRVRLAKKRAEGKPVDPDAGLFGD